MNLQLFEVIITNIPEFFEWPYRKNITPIHLDIVKRSSITSIDGSTTNK